MAFELATKVKICILGETVGKSSLVNAFVNKTFCGKQIEHQNMEDIHHKQHQMMNQMFQLEITDTTNNDEADRIYDDILKIEWKGMDGYSLDIREHWLMNNDIIFLCFNRVNRLSWMILQALHDVTTQYLSKHNKFNVPMYIISTCSDLYLSQTSLANLDSIDLVSFKEVEEYIARFDNAFHYETSAKRQHNIVALFEAAVIKYNELHPSKKKKRKRKKSMSQTSKPRKTVISPSQTSKSPKSPLSPKQKRKTSKQTPKSPKSPNLYNAEPISPISQNIELNLKLQKTKLKPKLNSNNNNNDILQKQEIKQSNSKPNQTTKESITKKEEQKTMTDNHENNSSNMDMINVETEQKTQHKCIKQSENKPEISKEETQPIVNDVNEEFDDKDDEQKLTEDQEKTPIAHTTNPHNGYNGYNNNNGAIDNKDMCNMSNLSMSPISLSSQEIYNIEYSSKYKESMDFKNVQKTFNKYHQIKVLYEQQQAENINSGSSEYFNYKASCLLFFKDLDATLTTIGCIDNDKKIFFIQCRQHIIFKMINTINLCKNQYEYLAKITLLTGPLTLSLEHVQRDDYWSVLSDASFVSKLSIDYNEWMLNHSKSENEFKNELSGALHINPIYIRINGVGKGFNDIVIDWTVMYIWIPYYIQGVESNLMYREYRMRPQDQIEVQYKQEWIACTILQVKDTLNKKGKQIKVRYNKSNGYDRFMTSNTEWLWTIKQYHRLRLPDKVYVIVSYNGVKIGTTFKVPLLAYCKNNNKQLLDIGHHIFVNQNNIWYRCEVIDQSMDGKKIQILYLVNTFVKNTEWLRLFEPADLKRISLEDMRM